MPKTLPPHPARRPWSWQHKKHPVPEPGVVRLKGEIDIANWKRTEQILLHSLRTRPELLEVDLARVTHLSGDGSLALFSVLRAARSLGARVVVTQTQPQVASALTWMGLTRVLGSDWQDGTLPA